MSDTIWSTWADAVFVIEGHKNIIKYITPKKKKKMLLLKQNYYLKTNGKKCCYYDPMK